MPDPVAYNPDLEPTGPGTGEPDLGSEPVAVGGYAATAREGAVRHASGDAVCGGANFVDGLWWLVYEHRGKLAAPSDRPGTLRLTR